jgi:hypothetical protein
MVVGYGIRVSSCGQLTLSRTDYSFRVRSRLEYCRSSNGQGQGRQLCSEAGQG